MAPSDKDLFTLTVNTDCYRELDDAEHNKVNLAMQGKPASTPRSNIGKVAFYLARRIWPVNPSPPPPPPIDPKTIYFPRTFNKEGTSDARFCVSRTSPAYSHEESPDRIFDKGGGVYNLNGLCDGGRDPDFIAKWPDGTPLRGAKSMDSFGPCDLYDGHTAWPPDSYKR